MAPIPADDVLTTAFRPIARDGAGNVEVCLQLCEALKAIRAISPERFGAAVRATAADLLERVRAGMSHPADVQAVARAAEGTIGEKF